MRGSAAASDMEADQLPDGDIVGVPLRQHAGIVDTIERLVQAGRGESRVTNFAALATVLRAHEMAEHEGRPEGSGRDRIAQTF